MIKHFPGSALKKEPFPRVFSTRNTIRDGSLYFGPYTSGSNGKNYCLILSDSFTN